MPSNIFCWYGQFRGGWEGIQDDPSNGHPSWVLNRRQHQKGSAAVAAKLSPVISNDSGWAWHQQGYFTEDCHWRSWAGGTLCTLCTACIDCRTGLSGCRFLAKKSITVLHHPSYLPDLALADWLLFLKVKWKPKGCHFDTISDIQNSVTSKLKSVAAANFCGGFQNHYDHASRCIELGMYVEG